MKGSAATTAVLAVFLGAAPESCPRRESRPVSTPAAATVAAAEPTAAPEPTPALAPAAPAPAPKDGLFETTLRPVLATKCTPCHWPGGRMYERMPFDDPRTITGHLEGVRRRLKGEDRETLEKWIASLPPVTPSR